MKKTIIALALLCSTGVAAETYVGVGLQLNNPKIGEDQYKKVQVGSQLLDLNADGSDSSFRVFGGYRFTSGFGLELAYSDFSQEASHEVWLSVLEEEEWEADFNVKQLELTATYFYPLLEKLQLKASAGVVWHDTDFSYGHKIDVEDGADRVQSYASRNDSKLGVVAGLGLQYNVWQNVDVVAGYQYSRSSLVDNSAIFFAAGYRF